MGSTAVQIITEAYRKHNLDEVTQFSTSLEFPFDIAKDVINDVIRFLNRMGSFYFAETVTTLTYGVSTYTYDLSSSNYLIDPKRIRWVRKEATDKWAELTRYNKRQFMQAFRRQALQTAEPTAFTIFANTLELNTQPDQDYTIKVYHFRDLPAVTSTSDTFLIPERDEDLLIQACYHKLGAYIGRWGHDVAEVMIRELFKDFLADLKQDSNYPTQMPAAF